MKFFRNGAVAKAPLTPDGPPLPYAFDWGAAVMRLALPETWRRSFQPALDWAARTGRAVLAFIRRWDKDALERAENDARKAERRLREAIDVLPEGVVFLDAEGRYILWNKRYADIYHRSADLFEPGRKLADTLRIGVARGDYPDAIGREEEWIAQRLALMTNPGERHEQRLSDGRWIMIEERGTSEGGVIGLRVDITDMKEQAQALRQALQRAEAANKAKSDFLANMSHEIRTPLNGVLGLASILERSRLDPDQHDMIQTIMASANTLNMLLSDLLTFARLESGRLQLDVQPFDLKSMIQETAALFRGDIQAKGLSLELDLEDDGDEHLLGDAPRLKQVLLNLLSNAVKFTAEGAVGVRLRGVGQGETRRFVIEVADSGIGFDPDDAERLFRRFEQADASVTRRYGGTGLGLAICRQIVDLMGGSITATGRPGKGATFTVELCLPSAAAASAPRALPDTPVDPLSAAAGLRILVAEDNPTNRKVVKLMLASIGADPDCVENGQEAVEAARRCSYDLALIDLQMPVMDGLTAIGAIRAEEAARDRPRLPMIVLSANVMPEHLAASKAAGADGHIGKPIQAAELFSAIAVALQPDSEPTAVLRAG